MTTTTSNHAASLRSAWLAQAQARPWVSRGLAGAARAVGPLWIAGGINAKQGNEASNRRYAMLGGSAGFVATAVGALLAIGLRDISTRTQDSMLGFAAGMMLAASAFSLILPGLEAGRELFGSGPAAALTDRKSTRLNSSHVKISYAVFCLKKKKQRKADRYV